MYCELFQFYHRFSVSWRHFRIFISRRRLFSFRTYSVSISSVTFFCFWIRRVFACLAITGPLLYTDKFHYFLSFHFFLFPTRLLIGICAEIVLYCPSVSSFSAGRLGRIKSGFSVSTCWSSGDLLAYFNRCTQPIAG